MKLDDVKTGHYVALYIPTIISGTYIYKIRVDRRTRTLIIAKNQKYKIKDGYEIGRNSGPYIRSLSPEVEQDIAKYEAMVEKADLISKIQKADYSKVPLKTLKQIIELINIR